MADRPRKHLSIEGLLREARRVFTQVPDAPGQAIPLVDYLMSGFLIDQIQQRGCRLFRAAVTAAKSKTRFWRKLRTRFDLCLIPDWETLYRSIITPLPLPLGANTS